jgi:hypothetical protein
LLFAAFVLSAGLLPRATREVFVLKSGGRVEGF